MGATISAVTQGGWEGIGHGRDPWGFKPNSLRVPTQQITSQLGYEGYPTGRATFQPFPEPGDQSKVLHSVHKRDFGLGGQGTDIMSGFGAPQNLGEEALQNTPVGWGGQPEGWVAARCEHPGEPECWWRSQPPAYGQYPFVYKDPAEGGWTDDKRFRPMGGDFNAGNLCTPENYPQCQVTSWLSGAANDPEAPGRSVYGYQKFWAYRVLGDQVPGDYAEKAVLTADSARYVQEPMYRKPVDIWARFQQQVDQLVQNYAGNQTEGLSEVCTKETSSYDNCANVDTIGQLLPVVGALIAWAGLRVYGGSFLSNMPAESAVTLQVGTVLTGYDAVKAAYLGSSWFGSEREASDLWYTKQSATMMITTGYLVGVAVANGPLAGYSVWMRALAKIGMSYLFYRNLTTYNKRIVEKMGGGLKLGLFMAHITGFFQKLWCNLATAGISACDQPEKFPDSRNWDIPSLAAQLADKMLEEQGWQRDDPRALFVYRGLIQGPALFLAGDSAVPKFDFPLDGGMMKTELVNPIGQFYQQQTRTNPVVKSKFENDMITHTRGSVWDADSPIANGWWQFDMSPGQFKVQPQERGKVYSEANAYQCNNFDVMYYGRWDYSGDGTMKETDCNIVKTWQKYIRSLVEAAQNPNNLLLQGAIPGFDQSGFKAQFWYDQETYIKTCHQDFENANWDRTEPPFQEFGTGFNTVADRGSYPGNIYPLPLFGSIDNEQDALLYANSYFNVKDERAAFDMLKREFGVLDDQLPGNLVKIVHYWHEDKGYLQEADFRNNWQAVGDNEILDILATDPPAEWSFPFQAFQPVLKNPFQHLQPPLTPVTWKGPFKPLQPPLTPVHHPVTPLESVPFEQLKAMFWSYYEDGWATMKQIGDNALSTDAYIWLGVPGGFAAQSDPTQQGQLVAGQAIALQKNQLDNFSSVVQQLLENTWGKQNPSFEPHNVLDLQQTEALLKGIANTFKPAGPYSQSWAQLPEKEQDVILEWDKYSINPGDN